MVVPAGAVSRKRIQPTMFCPMSRTVSPPGVFKTFTGVICSMALTGGPAGATSFAFGVGKTVTDFQFLSSNPASFQRSEEHTSELQSRLHLVCRLLLEKKKKFLMIAML